MILAPVVLLLALAQESGEQAPSLPRTLTLDEPILHPAQDPKEEPLPRPDPASAQARSTPVLDLDWLELTPGAGVAIYSHKYLADPSVAFLLSARAPIPWLSPGSDPHGEYFGLFAEAAFMPIDRALSTSVDHRRGLATLSSVGLDFSLVRDGTWILIARGGGLYAYYSDIAQLHSGLGFMVGASAGLQISGKTALTYSPELLFGKSGSLIFLNTAGFTFQF